MKIQNITPVYVNKYDTLLNKKTEQSSYVESQKREYINSYEIPFLGVGSVLPKKLNIEQESKKLLRHISEILEFDTSGVSDEERKLATLRKMLEASRKRWLRFHEIYDEIVELDNNKLLTKKEKLDKALALHKELKRLEKNKIEKPKTDKPKNFAIEDKVDFQLLHKLKSAVMKGDFNLLAVYKNYYAGLLNITDLETLAKEYPKIKIPPKPEDVIAKRIVDSLTRDFYEEFDKLYQADDYEGIVEHSDKVINKVCDSLLTKYNIDPTSAYKRLARTAHKAIATKFAQLKSSNSFSSIPYNRKIKEAQVNPLDVALLRVDFSDFVLNVLRRQFVGSEKLNDIVYEANGVKIPVKSLGNTEYKMLKSSDRIRTIITSGEKIKAAQRDYDRFDVDELKARLEYFAFAKSGNEPNLFNKIIEFNSSRFEPEDISNLRKFMRKLDEFEDGDVSLDDVERYIYDEKISPKGTEQIDALERENFAQLLKVEQRKAFELKSMQEDFEEALDILYKNDMNSTASMCSKYRPLSLEPDEVQKSQTILGLIKSMSKAGEFNKSKLEASIARFDTYHFYAQNKPNAPAFLKAQAFAKNSEGVVDIDKAGQYLVNNELLENYPDSKSFVRYPEILEKIIDKSSNTDDAIKYLFKFDAYTTMSDVDKTKIEKIVALFDSSDSIEKFLLKHIVEGDYSSSSTLVKTKLNEKGSEYVESVFAQDAKQQILEKYKFPTCLEYFTAFEDALSYVSASKSSPGVKITGSNNKALAYKMEVKVKGHDDRLFSSQNNYVFDIFSERGLH